MIDDEYHYIENDLENDMECNECGSTDLKTIHHMTANVCYHSMTSHGVKKVQLYQCRNCKNIFTADI